MIVDDRHLLELAYRAARHSTDPSTQMGAVAVSADSRSRAASHNRPVRGYDPDRHDKYRWTVHAEAAALDLAAYGLPVLEHQLAPFHARTLACPWAACPQCALRIVQARVRRVVVHLERMDLTTPAWWPDVQTGLEILHRNDVELVVLEGPVPGAPPIRVAGRLWSPAQLAWLEPT